VHHTIFERMKDEGGRVNHPPLRLPFALAWKHAIKAELVAGFRQIFSNPFNKKHVPRI
jgi:hypothetical protein